MKAAQAVIHTHKRGFIGTFFCYTFRWVLRVDTKPPDIETPKKSNRLAYDSRGRPYEKCYCLPCWANRCDKEVSRSEGMERFRPQQHWPPDQHVIVFSSEGLWDRQGRGQGAKRAGETNTATNTHQATSISEMGTAAA